MKKIIIGLSALIVLSVLQAQFPTQQEKQAVLMLNKAEMENIWQIIDDAAVPGQIRKPLLQKIEAAYETAFQPKPVQQPKIDSTKQKKN